jgi:hypothetical protein
MRFSDVKVGQIVDFTYTAFGHTFKKCLVVEIDKNLINPISVKTNKGAIYDAKPKELTLVKKEKDTDLKENAKKVEYNRSALIRQIDNVQLEFRDTLREVNNMTGLSDLRNIYLDEKLTQLNNLYSAYVYYSNALGIMDGKL